MGTGVIVDARGYVVTNYHVVEGVRRIEVTLSSGRTVAATLVSHDPRTDLAVIKIPAEASLPVIDVGTSGDLMIGETVLALGNAYGYEHTVTRGIVSALHRDVEVSGPTRGGLPDEVAKGPIRLQGDHGPIAFRKLVFKPL
jgi:serine protease Do